MSRVIFTIGVFDLFHRGHKALFRQMAQLGDKIVVGVHDRQSTFINKGINLVDPLPLRLQHVRNQPKVERTYIVDRADPSEVMQRIIDEYKAKGHKLIYIRGNDWSEFPGRGVLEQEGVPIHFKEYTSGISSTALRKRLDELTQALYNALTDETVPDEDIVPLLEEAIFMPSDAVMHRVYKRLYDEGRQDVFGDRFLRLSKLIGELWNRPESKDLIPRFINRMGINTADLERDPSSFKSLNAFFARQVDLKKRLLEEHPRNIASPGDGLILIYQNTAKAKKYYIKGRNFSLPALFDYKEEYIQPVKGGSMVIVRLQPHDIHRFYAPLKGKMGTPYWTGTRLHTVKSDIVARSDVDVFTENSRVIIPFHETSIGRYFLTAISAPLINSIVLHQSPGDEIKHGQELGYFQYGGSSIVLSFPQKPKIKWKFPQNKSIEAETPVLLHQTIGRILK
jgi:phosphatidylserine decarboxylase precursor